MMTWQIGVASGVCIHRPIAEVLPIIRSSGAEGVEIGTPPDHFNPGVPADVEAAGQLFRTLGLTPVSIHAPFARSADLASPNRQDRERAITAHVQAVDALVRIGGRIVVAHPSDLERRDHDVEACLEHSARGLGIIGDYCRDVGVVLAVESPLPHLIGGHPDEFRWLLTELDSTIRVCLDTGHVTLGHHWQAFVECTGTRLAHVHASDNHGTYDDHLPPGDGRIDWSEIRRSLHSVSFDGWIMLELACERASEVEFKRALTQAQRLLAP